MGFCNIFEKIWQSKPEPESEESKERRFESIFVLSKANNGLMIYSPDDREDLEKFLLKKGYRFKEDRDEVKEIDGNINDGYLDSY